MPAAHLAIMWNVPIRFTAMTRLKAGERMGRDGAGLAVAGRRLVGHGDAGAVDQDALLAVGVARALASAASTLASSVTSAWQYRPPISPATALPRSAFMSKMATLARVGKPARRRLAQPRSPAGHDRRHVVHLHWLPPPHCHAPRYARLPARNQSDRRNGRPAPLP
jgi:hypothetical protein